jgi:ABC-type sugar transport system substrate-binding protein
LPRWNRQSAALLTRVGDTPILMAVDAIHVVLCHAVDDHARADALARALRAEGVQVWIDTTPPNTSQEARRETFGQALEAASACVFLIAEGHFSRWQREQAAMVRDWAKSGGGRHRVVIISDPELAWCPQR